MSELRAKLVSDQDYLESLLNLISMAKKSINLMAYSFAIGSAGGKINMNGAPYEIASALKEVKRKKGDKLQIRLFTEGLRETSLRNKVTVKFLKEAGVEVKSGSTHAKGICVDGRYVLFGSTNLTHQSIMKNHEANLLLDNRKIAKEFLRYFDHHWNGGGHGGIKLKLPFLADGDFKDFIIDMIQRAKKKVEFSIYFFNHREIEKALIKAYERGVKVTGFIHQHKSFALSYIHANRATFRRLHEAGLKNIYLSRFGNFYHSKYLIIDGKELALGTGNWLVEDVKIHPQLYIYFKDMELARKLSRHLSSQIKHQSIEAT